MTKLRDQSPSYMEGLPIIRVGISADSTVSGGSRRLFELAEIPLQIVDYTRDTSSYGLPSPILSVILDSQTCVPRRPTRDQMSLMMLVDSQSSEEIRQRVKSGGLAWGIVDPEAEWKVSKDPLKVTALTLPRKKEGALVRAILIAGEVIDQAVISAERLGGIENPRDRIIAKVVRASRLVERNANLLKNQGKLTQVTEAEDAFPNWKYA
jgi:hypothetical protein